MLVNKKPSMILLLDMGQIGLNQGLMHLTGLLIETTGYEEIGDRAILDREGWTHPETDGEKKILPVFINLLPTTLEFVNYVLSVFEQIASYGYQEWKSLRY